MVSYYFMPSTDERPRRKAKAPPLSQPSFNIITNHSRTVKDLDDQLFSTIREDDGCVPKKRGLGRIKQRYDTSAPYATNPTSAAADILPDSLEQHMQISNRSVGKKYIPPKYERKLPILC
eukprot:TRINITY_DN78906_c0_g1_i1.p1 TRINITY_DN78906_c0_g1~~TRINITY_DN78906_c0_g1_i1.p1  ORF type:complete len:120 (-),score=6.04 TRINITY_DN78906_c0_g1_i1:141-500(-)